MLHLVDWPLLTPPQAGPYGRSRYAMAETLRLSAARQLAQAGEEGEVMRRSPGMRRA